MRGENRTRTTSAWSTTSRRGRALIEHWFEVGWGRLEPGVVDEVCAPGVVAELPVGRCTGVQTLKDLMTEVGAGLVDLEYGLDVIGSGHDFAATYSLTGHHRRTMFGAPATNTRVTLRGLATYHVERGRIVEFSQTASVTAGQLPIGALHVPPEGTPWMVYGAFWSVIKMVKLTLDGDRADTDFIDLAARDGTPISAPFLFRRCGYYHLFVSFDDCCLGVDSTYNLRVGRSVSLFGPYVDRDGVPMLEGGGTLLLESGGDWVGPGHSAIVVDGTSAYAVYHAYSASDGAPQIRISEMVWDAEGWPISAGP